MKSIASILFFVFGSLFVAAVWLATLCTSQEKFGTASLDPLFTGLALVAAIAVYAHEREKSADRDREHQQLLKSMGAQVKATCHAARVVAFTAVIANDELTLRSMNVQGVSTTEGTGKVMFQRMNDLQRRIGTNRRRLDEAAEIVEFF